MARTVDARRPTGGELGGRDRPPRAGTPGPAVGDLGGRFGLLLGLGELFVANALPIPDGGFGLCSFIGHVCFSLWVMGCWWVGGLKADRVFVVVVRFPPCLSGECVGSVRPVRFRV